jgi:translation initiation factor 2D
LLWAIGDRTFPEGFTLSGVERIAQPAPSAEGGEDEEEVEGGDDLEHKAAEDSDTGEMEKVGEVTEGTEEQGDRDFEAAMAGLDVDEQEGGAEGEADAEEKQEAAGVGEAAMMDQLIVTTFLRAAKYVVKDRQLPMLASTFYASYMLPARPDGSVIELKHSSFKKVTAFLEEMACRRLITLQVSNGGRPVQREAANLASVAEQQRSRLDHLDQPRSARLQVRPSPQ